MGNLVKKTIILKQGCRNFIAVTCFVVLFLINFSLSAMAEDLNLTGLINQSFQTNPEIREAEAKLCVAKYRVPQEKALPDPQATLGYQNGSFSGFDLGSDQLAWFVTGISQTFPFYGKRTLRGKIASHEVMQLESKLNDLKLRTASRVKDLYYELFLAYKELDIIENRASLYTRMEEAALSRYSTGLGQQQDVLLAQTDKYNLLTKKEQLKQKIQSTEAALNALLGKDVSNPIPRPENLEFSDLPFNLEQLNMIAYQKSPVLMAGEKTIEQQGMKVKLAKKDALPDFTLNAFVLPRGGSFPPMWMLTTSFNLPVYYHQKQRNAILEAEAQNTAMKYNYSASRLDLSSNIRDSYSTVIASEKIMKIYNEALMARASQSFESALAGYAAGKNDALTAITPLRNLIDYEELYWEQFVIREKAIAKLQALTGVADFGHGGS